MTTETTAATPPVKAKKPGMGDVYRAMFREPRVAIMLALGFSSGLPFLLTAGTLGYWLRDEGTTLKAIGFLSWVGFAYSFKFLWSPFIDRLDAPLVGKWLGRRRGWMLVAQTIVALGLVGMAIVGPQGGLVLLGSVALVVAFASATQDIVVDAWRIEAAETSEELGLMSSAYQLGYRFAIITSDALILFIANHAGWPVSYGVMAVLMGIGVWATLKATEPLRTRTASEEKAGQDALWTPRGFFDAVVGPFIAFFKTYAWLGLLMLAFISLYRLPEFVMGPMATPFYHDLGLSKDVVGAVRTSFGLAGSLAGIAVGGLVIARFGYMKGLIIGGIMQALAIASFGALAMFADSMGTSAVTFPVFGSVMFFDNFGVAMAGVALVTYMSTLTSLGYTATQYALLSSTYAIVGKFLKGFSGVVVENIEASGFSLMQSYGVFFVGAGAIGLPAVALVIWLAMVQPKKTGPDAAT
ncbi:MAG: MFS transporter [Brevundimonas sp.]|nr:MAG: MFS transporter [Brevundimonas sp.]